MARIQRALLSVTDKTGIVAFAKGLAGLNVELISTGGTAKVLRDAGLPVQDVADVTRFPEMLDGRVKTLHPFVAGGILHIRDNAEHQAAVREHGIPAIDMVVVNLYQFEKFASKPGVTLEELIENIDIGGPTMIRAAAKNWQDVAVVVNPDDYDGILKELRTGALSRNTLWSLAKKAFAKTAAYDRAIIARLDSVALDDEDSYDPAAALPPSLDINVPRRISLRYGENPHQSAALYAEGNAGIAGAEQLHGKELSYNNLVDLDAAWQLVQEFDAPAASIIKHTNPCGCAEQPTLREAYLRAYEADTVSAFGGVLAFNRPLDGATAEEVSKLFVEAIAAPGFDEEALTVLRTKKNLRLVRVAEPGMGGLVVKSITGGYLAQTADLHKVTRSKVNVVTHREPTEEEWAGLLFGWRVCKHVKSNAIVYARAGQTLSVGAGQMSRVDSAKFGAMKAVLPLQGCVVASDAFFPFPDGLEFAASQGATAFIQPGGSVKDQEVIDAANALGVAMVFTGVRHFRH